ncbi:hypothetical protein EGW08_008949 [Elysia chlorotica]|uniref:Ig-like domain-containing protein n=1 Tax=Elysia chlorotica TaxID=188477 RepID=A0A3S0ZQB8_ELYCH|nr:hypothetical protein EGW08_008949 [Elysia chlorotica]
MAESRLLRGMRTPHRLCCCLLLLLAGTAAVAMAQDIMPDTEKLHHVQKSSSPSDLAIPGEDQPPQTLGVPHPDPLYNLHLETPLDLKDGSPSPSQAGYHRGRVFPQGMRSTTSSLPRFLPQGHRRFTPDPRLLPGDSDIRVLQGSKAVLPCTVQYLGTRQISWQKVGNEHLLSIGTEIWVKDENLRVEHHLWPADVGDWNLVFEETRLEDSGEYECQVISTEKLTHRVRLSVVVINIEGKKFVEHGQTVYLRCNTTEGDRVPEDVDWFKDGDKIDDTLYPKVFITKHRSEVTKSLVSELMITSGTSKDTGTYICRSSSQLIASIEVNVLIADSANVKRGTGTSHTQVGTHQNDENAAILYPSFLGNRLILFLTVLSALVVRQLVT